MVRMEEPIDPEVEDEIAYLEQKRMVDEYRPIYRAQFIALWGKDPFAVGDKI